MIALRVTRRPGATDPDAAALALPESGLTIGRADDCDLVLADPLRLVSRQHAQVTAAGDGARVRCTSSTAPLWVNEVPLDPGQDRELRVGDCLRIGRFELTVEPAASRPPQRSRLDRWFDLDEAPDPLAAGSPLPELEPAIEAPAQGPVVSWQTRRHVVRAEPSVDSPPVESSPVVSAPLVSAPLVSAPLVSAPLVSAPAPAPVVSLPVESRPVEAPPVEATPARPPAPAPRKRSSRAGEPPPQLRELAAAFARGAGLQGEPPALTAEWMQHIGALLRTTAEGTLALLQSRAVAKRHMRAAGTHIAPRQNNPLKFAPDASEALTRMLHPEASPGFLDPVAALNDAHRDLLVHQVAMVAGMRAAVFELFTRLGPQAAEDAEGPARGLASVPVLRAAALWKRHCVLHAQLLEHLDDDFETIFGREFLRAYEAQSRVDPGEPASPREAP